MIQRRGSTLIELVLSMMAGSGIMLLGISLVHQALMLSEQSSNRAIERKAPHAATRRPVRSPAALPCR